MGERLANASDREQFLLRGDIPEFESTVVTRSCQGFAIRRERNRPDTLLMTVALAEQFSVPGVPQTDRVVKVTDIRGCGQNAAIRGKCDT